MAQEPIPEPTGNRLPEAPIDALRALPGFRAAGQHHHPRGGAAAGPDEPDVAEQAKRIVRLSDGQIVEDRRLTALTTAAARA